MVLPLAIFSFVAALFVLPLSPFSMFTLQLNFPRPFANVDEVIIIVIVSQEINVKGYLTRANNFYSSRKRAKWRKAQGTLLYFFFYARSSPLAT